MAKVNKYTIYPPTGEVGKCACEYSGTAGSNYDSCVQCNMADKYNAESLRLKCNLLIQDQSIKSLYTEYLNAMGTGGNTTTPTTQPNTNSSVMNTGTTINKNPNTSSVDNNITNNDSSATEKEESSFGGTTYIALGVIVCVAVAGVAGFVIYNKKQKSRPESMPFYGGSVSSPNHFATLNSTKPTNQYETMNNNNFGTMTQTATPLYNGSNTNNQYYDNATNQYGYDYQQPPATYAQDQQAQAYDQYDPNYQYDQTSNPYSGQGYEEENLVAGAAATGVAAYNFDTTQRRESMRPTSNVNDNIPIVSNNMTYICQYKYDPSLDDELELKVDDQVQIIEEYEDGWMKARNLTSGKEGMAPRVCLRDLQ